MYGVRGGGLPALAQAAILIECPFGKNSLRSPDTLGHVASSLQSCLTFKVLCSISYMLLASGLQPYEFTRILVHFHS